MYGARTDLYVLQRTVRAGIAAYNGNSIVDTRRLP